ncbi:MAG: arylsulfatase [Deltaproteobacteria bacterium]|nr:arylsulfatase [Deltaproteobacteria bacterium]
MMNNTTENISLIRRVYKTVSMNILTLVVLLVATAMALSLTIPGTAFAKGAEKPNIVFILVDNWGWGDISIQGGKIATPKIDRLASEGLRFTNYNVETQCTPTRAAIHTGRLPIRSGTFRVTHGTPYGLAPWEYTIAELLSDSGYDTALFGKWHLGRMEGRLPTNQGYDEWYGIKNSSGTAGYTSTPDYDSKALGTPNIWKGRKGQPSEEVEPFNMGNRGLIDREIVERSGQYIRKHAKSDNPFFLYVGMTQFHPPEGTHPDFVGKSNAGPFSDLVMEVDHHIGMILQSIEDAGIEDETIVILTGDNGTVPGVKLEGFRGSNGPFRGGLNGYEGGLRTVGMIRWPKKIQPGQVSDEIIASLDWMPTLAHIIGQEDRIPDDRPIDGINQADFIFGKQKKSNREHIIAYVGKDLHAVKWRSFKIHFKTTEDRLSPVQTYSIPPIFNLKNDPGERHPLFRYGKFEYTWVFTQVRKIVTPKKISMKVYPNIKVGEDFSGYNYLATKVRRWIVDFKTR